MVEVKLVGKREERERQRQRDKETGREAEKTRTQRHRETDRKKQRVSISCKLVCQASAIYYHLVNTTYNGLVSQTSFKLVFTDPGS